MRRYWHIILMASLIGIVLASCQPKPAVTPTLEKTPNSPQNETITQSSQEQFLPYIPPAQGESGNPPLQGGTPYPPPAQAGSDNPSAGQNLPGKPTPGQGNPAYNPYPGPSEGANNFLDWAAVEKMILDGKVSKIYHSPTGHITLVLKDGTVAVTIEPAVDEVFKVIERCGQVCSDIEQIKQ